MELLFEGIDQPGLNTLAVYQRERSGYEMLTRALDMEPADVLSQLQASGLRGRGGAGFAMGTKASFLPKGDMDKYVVCNADESEPGTFKDRELMQKNPHRLIEGIGIAAHAVGANKAFIFIRGEYAHQADILEAALAEAKAANVIGGLDLWVHRGAGAYICGEETALLDALEGKRGNPRLKPPFPAVQGLYRGPTLINDLAGGPPDGRSIKFWFPGGSSAPVLPGTDEYLDLPYDFESMAKAGSMLGSAAIIVVDDSVPVMDVALKTAKFYRHESCGKCTPCREGTNWTVKMLERIDDGTATPMDLDIMASVCDQIMGNCLCVLGDAMAMPIASMIKHFRPEFEAHIEAARERNGLGIGAGHINRDEQAGPTPALTV